VKKIGSLYLLWLFFCPDSCIAQSFNPDNNSDAIERLSEYVYILASDTMEGREAGTPGGERAAKWISETYKNLGLYNCDTCVFSQRVGLIKANGDSAYSDNLYGYLLSESAKKWVVVCAHYDHIGKGGKYSRSPLQKQTHNGADDNASGVAVMLEIAYRLSQTENTAYNFLFAAFTGHETGLYGSRYFVDNPPICIENVKCLINIDMVGRLDEETNKLVVCTSSANDNVMWSPVDSLSINSGFDIVKRELPQGDHSPFLLHNICSLFISTGIHDDYHTVNDKPCYINFKGMADVSLFLGKILISLKM